jgi:hypothetical protein
VAQDRLKIRYVHRVVRGAREYLYFRKGDYHEGPLASAYGTPELQAEVDAILTRLTKAQEAAAKPMPNTIGGILRAYNKSAEFLSNARSTQRSYKDYIDGDDRRLRRRHAVRGDAGLAARSA